MPSRQKLPYFIGAFAIAVVAAILVWGLPQQDATDDSPIADQTDSATADIPLPTIPTGDTTATKLAAVEAEDLRRTLHALHTVRTQRELKARQDRIRALSRELTAKQQEALPALGALLADPAPEVRLRAVGILGEMDAPHAASPLARTVREDAHCPVRLQALVYLENLRTLDPADRRQALAASREALLTVLADEDAEIRKAAQRTLWALAQLQEGYNATAPPEARQAALQKLTEKLDEMLVEPEGHGGDGAAGSVAGSEQAGRP
jgi:hypothetical protein